MPYLPASLMPEALAMARALPGPEQQADALVALCVCLPEKMRLDGCQETLSVVQAISSPAARASALARLAAGLPGNCFHDQLVEMCQAVIRDLSMQPCKELLNSLGTLTPVLSFLGDDESIVDTYRAITDVTRWCP